MNWNYSDAGLLYLSFSQGYKSGAYPGQTPFPDQAVVALEPEFATNYEIGFKSQFWSDRLRLNGSVFSTDYEDLQVFQLVDSLLVSGNAEATSQGIELEFTGLLTEYWTIVANYAWLDAEYEEYILGDDDFGGNTLPKAAENSFYVRSSYIIPLNGGAEIDLVVSYAYSDDIFYEPANTEISREGSYGLFDASVNWRSADAAWDVSLWAKNLNDEEYRVHTIVSNVLGTVDIWAPPRTYGVTASYAF